MASEKKPSLNEAVEAYVALMDSGGGSGRRINRLYNMVREASKASSGSNVGPIVPEDERPELDADQEQAVEFNLWAAGRIDDLVHPGGRLQKADEAIETILAQAKEGTLAVDGARKIAADAKEAAEKTGKKTAAEEAGADKKGAAAKEKTVEKNAAAESSPGSGSATSTPGGVPAASKKSGS